MKKYCIKQDYTIKEAIESINRNKDRIAIVTNNEDKVIGVVSQGDIIRALTFGKSLYSRVADIIKSDFLYLNNRDMEEAYRLFRKLNITLLPVVDEGFCLVDVIVLNDIYVYLEGKCIN